MIGNRLPFRLVLCLLGVVIVHSQGATSAQGACGDYLMPLHGEHAVQSADWPMPEQSPALRWLRFDGSESRLPCDGPGCGDAPDGGRGFAVAPLVVDGRDISSPGSWGDGRTLLPKPNAVERTRVLSDALGRVVRDRIFRPPAARFVG